MTEPRLETCPEALGTIRIDEQTSAPWYSSYASRYSTGSTVPALRLLIQQSNCFVIIDRGRGLQAANQERDLIRGAEGQAGSNYGTGQIAAADYTLVPNVIISDRGGTRGGGGLAAVGGLFGSTGAALGAVAGSFSTNEAGTVLTVVDNRSSVQVAAPEGYAKDTDFGGMSALFRGGAAAGAGAYTSTPQGKVLLASFLEAYNKLVVSVRNYKAQVLDAGIGPTLIAAGGSAAAMKELEHRVKPSSQSEVRLLSPRTFNTPDRTLNPYVNFDAPPAVESGQHFAALLWFSPSSESTGVRFKPAADRPTIGNGRLGIDIPSGVSKIRIQAILSADGFDIYPNGSNIVDIVLNEDETSNPVRFDLVARNSNTATRRLQATLWRDGAFLGSVARDIDVETPTSESVRATQRMGVLASPISRELAFNLPPDIPTTNIRSRDSRNSDQSERIAIVVGTNQPLVADITVRVQLDDPRVLGGADIQIGSPYLSGVFDHKRWSFPPDSEEWLALQIERINRLRAARDDNELNQNVATIRGIGELLYERLAPEPFKKVLTEVIGAKKRGDDLTIQIYSDNPVIPWEIMRPGNIASREVDFLGMAFRIARWPVKTGERTAEIPLQDMPMKELVLIAPRYTGDQQLSAQSEEVKFLEKLRGFRHSAGTSESLQTLAQKPPAGIVHFAGHGETTGATLTQRRHFIKLEDRRVDSTEWSGMFHSNSGASTFYFLNACETGSSVSQVGSASGWAQAMLGRGAGGFVGGQWALHDRAASSFAVRFYDVLANHPKGFNVAEALRTARKNFYTTGDSTDLAYVYYGDVNLEIALPP